MAVRFLCSFCGKDRPAMKLIFYLVMISNVRFGTRIMPSKRDVLIRGPTADAFEKCSLWSRNTEAECSPSMVKKYPTFSVIDSCISDKTALLAWQEDKIAKIGLLAFKTYMSERAAVGRRFHKTLEDLLTSKKNNTFAPLEKLLRFGYFSVFSCFSIAQLMIPSMAIYNQFILLLNLFQSLTASWKAK